MIQIALPPKPKKLTVKLEKELIKKYKNDGSDVWNEKFIRDAVTKIAFKKCIYTECRIGEESKYVEIDHYYPKNIYPDKVVEWGNLLPSCKKANTTKGDLDTLNEPIINPLYDNPKDHLYIKGFRFYHKTDIGLRTLDYTAINDRVHFGNKRAEICLEFGELLDEILKTLVEDVFLSKTNTSKLKRAVNKYKGLLAESNREQPYSATISTYILYETCNEEIINLLKYNNCWDSELDDLVDELKFCSLPK